MARRFTEAEIREAFAAFDRDGNGFIGANDLHSTYKALNENLSDDEVTQCALAEQSNSAALILSDTTCHMLVD